MESDLKKPVETVLIGAGNRGRGVFGQFALNMPHKAKFVAVVEPDAERRLAFGKAHAIPTSMQFEEYGDFFSQKKRCADAMIIATQETHRLAAITMALSHGYNLLVEKPLGCSPEEVIKITDLAIKFDGIFMICHQMRYIPLYDTIKGLIDSRCYGEIISVTHSENLSFDHMAHSFVRGFNNNDRMTPMILAKSCHDMDILRYLINQKPLKISSFGSLTYFKTDHAPQGAPEYCLDGCPAHAQCPYNVMKMYLSDDTDPAYLRQMGLINSKSQLLELLKTNQFGRCVFRCDNNVVDHQVVQIEFDNGTTASFQMAGHNFHERRITKISLTNGEIEMDFTKGDIKAYSFSPKTETIIKPSDIKGGHMGGDNRILDAFYDAVQGMPTKILSPVTMTLDSHLMAFAAEEARRHATVIDMRKYEAALRDGIC